MDTPESTMAWLWLSGSLFSAILWTNIKWFFHQPRSGAIGEYFARLTSWRFAPELLQILRSLYYIGLPYAALLWGRDAVVGQFLGLGQEQANAPLVAHWLDWARDTGWAAALGIGAWTLLALGFWTYHQALSAAGNETTIAGTNASGWVFLREAAYHEVHWAFYRNAPIMTLKKYDGGEYWGVWVGLLLAALEAMLNPVWRKSLSNPRKAPASLMRSALTIVSSVLFLTTRNLWLALALHWIVSWGLAILAQALPLTSNNNHSPPQKPLKKAA